MASARFGVAGIYHRRPFFLNAFPNRSRSLPLSLALGLAVYCIGFMTIALFGSALYFTPLFHRRNTGIIFAMSPHTPLEFVGWFFVSLSAGVCEELIFRGYLLQQFSAWLKSPVAAIAASGALFGCVHLYEGVAAVIPLAALGMVYAFVVHRCKGDLRAVIVAHTLQDFLVALLLLARPFAERYQPHT